MSPVAPPKTVSSPSILSQINEAKSQINRTQQLWVITLGILVLTLAIGIMGIQLPWQEQRQRLTAQYSEEKERSELLLALQRQKKELQSMEGKFLLVGGATRLAGQISQLAAQSGLQIESVTPQPELVSKPYTYFQIEIMTTGNLSNILRFLRTVEDHQPLLWTEQMDIGESPSEAIPSFMTTEDATTAKPKDQQKIRFLIGAVGRQKTS